VAAALREQITATHPTVLPTTTNTDEQEAA
jgi:hypothetical protein